MTEYYTIFNTNNLINYAAQRRSGAVDDMSDIWIDAALGDSSGGRQRGAVSGVSSAAVNAWGAGAALSRPSVRHSIDKGLDLLGYVRRLFAV